jgi:hypothetical protein
MNRRSLLGCAAIVALLVATPTIARAAFGASIIDVTAAPFNAQGIGGDDTAAIMAANATAVPGDVLYFPPGSYGLSQMITANCSLMGGGRIQSQLFAIPGSNLIHIVRFIDVSGFTVSGLRFSGDNSLQTVGGAAIHISNSADGIQDICLTNLRFDNFKASNWVWFYAHQNITRVEISNCHWFTHVGNGPSYMQGGDGGTCLAVFGSSTGMVYDFTCRDNIIDGVGVALGFAFYENVQKLSIHDNKIDRMGEATAANQNSYAIMVYGDTTPPTDVSIHGDIITSPASCGIYAATAASVTIVGERIKGQTRTDDVTLPRGAIALNGVRGGLVSGCDLEDNQFGISVAGGLGANPVYDLVLSGNRIRSTAGGTTKGIAFRGVVLAASQRIAVEGNDVFIYSGSGTAISGSISGSGDICILNNTMKAATIMGAGISGANVQLSPNY